MCQDMYNNFEQDYIRFIQKQKRILNKNEIDYFGINITNDFQDSSEFKIYYTDTSSRDETHPLIEMLEGYNMIRYLTKVKENQKKQADLRFDIGIKNRTNSNMEKVFSWLEENVVFFQDHRSEIIELAKMKMTNKDNFDYSSLYFIGFLSSHSEIKVLKFHFYNRICENPDDLYDNCFFDDTYYLNYLKESGYGSFTAIAQLVVMVLRVCGGHLWMTGIDCDKTGIRKYKIYIKQPENLYDGLEEAFMNEKYRGLKNWIKTLRVWNEHYPYFFCEGFAICIDNESELSINFYYVIKD